MTTSQIKATPVIPCQGGLDVSQFVVTTKPGAGVINTNFEPGLNGGYRRINGFTKFNTNAVTSAGSVLGVCVFNSKVLAFRGNDLYTATIGSSAWSSTIATRAGSITKVRFTRYNWNGTETVTITDGVNRPAYYDGTTYTAYSAGPTNPKYSVEFKGHMFFAGYTANTAEVTWTVPFDEDNFGAASGGGALVVGDVITALKSFRENLYIFCQSSIYVLSGSGLSTFAVQPVTRNIGCIAPDSVQEIGGDLVFLGPDGVRTLAATQRNDDVELGSITKDIQSIAAEIYTSGNIVSTVVKKKSQYRLFYNSTGTDEDVSYGLLGGIVTRGSANAYQQSSVGGTWEWYQLLGFKPYCCDNGYIGSTEYTVHGGYDGYVYIQDSGSNLNGANIRAQFRTPAIDFGDATSRKVIYKVNIYHKIESTTSTIYGRLYYDRETAGVSQPAQFSYTLDGSGSATYGTGIYGTSEYSVVSIPFQRHAVNGSGFLVQLDISTDDTSGSYTIEGFSFEYKMVAKR